MSEEFKFVIDTLKMVWSGCKWIFRCIMALFGFGKKSGLYDKGKKETVGKIILKFFIFEIIVVLVGQFFLLYRLNNVYFVLIYIPFIYLIVKLATRKKHNAKIDEATPAVATFPIESVTPHGVIFGRRNSLYIIKPEELDGHILVVGGVGSGKSSCIAIPTLRNWQDSVFAIDIKGELYEKTRKIRPNIKVFNPLYIHSYGYNPFYCLRTARNPAQEARAISQAIIPLSPETREPFWIESAQNILTGVILHYYLTMPFIETLKQIQLNNPKQLIEIVSQSGNEKARLCVGNFVGMDDKTLSGIYAELSKAIVTLITDDDLVSALSKKNVITPADLEYSNDIYIQIPEHLLNQWKNLLTLIVNQFLTFFERREETNARPILFLLDEFPRLGKIPAIMNGLATLRSKKISICLIIQSLAQLDVIYGVNERKVISDTCAYKAILNATDADTQEYFSRLVGTYDKPMTGFGTQRDGYIGFKTGNSTFTSEQERRIIKPEEFATLKDIVLLTPFGYRRVDKQPYYVKDKK